MPVPQQYQRATDEFYAFLQDARDEAGLGSTHQAFTMVQGVLLVFRRRLTLPDAIRFAGVLPVGLRALFVADWDPDEPRRAFEDLQVMAAEVKALRASHNFAPDDAIPIVARVLRRHVDEASLGRLLADLSPEARDFWDPGERPLRPR